MKILWPLPLLVCSLIAAGGIVVIEQTLLHQPPVFAANTAVQDGSTGTSTASLSGNWQMSWTSENGGQRQGTMELKQDGSKLSGKFQGERGAASLSGNLQGSQVSFNVKLRKRQIAFSGTVDGNKMSGTTEQGSAWTATRQQ